MSRVRVSNGESSVCVVMEEVAADERGDETFQQNETEGPP
jgi:hypothetical protein